MILSQSMLDDIEPETEPHLLRCDLTRRWAEPAACLCALPRARVGAAP